MHTPAKRAVKSEPHPPVPTQAALWETEEKHMDNSHLSTIYFGGASPVSKLLRQGYRARPLPIFHGCSHLSTHIPRRRGTTTTDDDQDTTGDHVCTSEDTYLLVSAPYTPDIRQRQHEHVPRSSTSSSRVKSERPEEGASTLRHHSCPPAHSPTHLALQYPYTTYLLSYQGQGQPRPPTARASKHQHPPLSYLSYRTYSLRSIPTPLSLTRHDTTVPRPACRKLCWLSTRLSSLLLRVSEYALLLQQPAHHPTHHHPPPHCITALSRFFCVAAPASHSLLHPASQIRQESVAFSGLPSAISSSQVPTSTPGQIQTHANPDQRRGTPYAIRKEEPFDIPSFSPTPLNL
ncbi:hypothetical protein JMJ77_0008755 [Colletotrichum scovillei]|uniref:Uncharacterized protein n=1 Tax=Colletotrichum scovillei TaxID=1209932 RepID=A0A9P7U634_9PEZI|nr:hypothetical protein JMJ78_0001609 [Colletotrichum scovillei]KAG7041050.1 hypothetical protein JMJ77_0008755 [Colletotrichum scovillei]KAG7061083.1 hypothetical protein JMJ76_0010153 [Colletotrichum scovillei]